MHMNIEFARKMSLAYNKTCKSLCQQLNIPQTAFDILMFLANNPEYKSARYIVEVRKLKANLVSVNVDKLVRDGYLERNSVEGDRRKTELLCTKKALPVIEQGKKLQHDFMEKTLTGISCDQRALLTEILDSIEKNLDIILQSE